ncbi:unnamed protein product [Rotaria sp. Silwood1]|nr:unnamed protein product [Rotaria sp. Silwood1]CAF3409473.1 unnamed protein product [Rotaria sp. Silwood1]CAF3414198.1 unnamed protein product [Rotaria sp. Silwood1]CAF4819918.1 unnamed protein product [Rotaria sp. Silwood1]CAF4848805.1 unnamed protein product [Rotaria sp. Silwood1]
MSSAMLARTPNVARKLDKNKLYLIGPNFWNVRGHFRVLKVIDIETQMSIIQLRNGKFLIIDTIDMNDRLRQEIDNLTNHGENIEAVIGVHPFHTLSFAAFYQAYPKAAYYGTPRHLRRLTEIPWTGDLKDSTVRKKWEPDVEMRIPAGAEFINPQPESTNHFISVFVYHSPSQTLHVDDTIMYAEKPGFLFRLLGCKHGSIAFHPSIKTYGLHPTSDAPYVFRDWMRTVLCDWPFENMCCAHLGVKIGGAFLDVVALLNDTEPLFAKLSEENNKKKFEDTKPSENHPNMNITRNECG